jgi:hypothetical protein
MRVGMNPMQFFNIKGIFESRNKRLQVKINISKNQEIRRIRL